MFDEKKVSPGGRFKKQSSCIDRDLGILFRIARFCGAWPLREAHRGKDKKNEKSPEIASSHEENCPYHFQVMCWKSWPPYLCVCVLLFFMLSMLYQGTNTFFLFQTSNISIPERLVSLPWFSCLVMPCLSNLLLLIKGCEVASLLCMWRCLETKMSASLKCTPTSRPVILLLIIYCIMALVSLGVLIQQFVEKPEDSVYYGNILPYPWSWTLHILQHVGVAAVWIAYLVSEVFLLIVAHHMAFYYRSIDHHIGNVLKIWVTMVNRDCPKEVIESSPTVANGLGDILSLSDEDYDTPTVTWGSLHKVRQTFADISESKPPPSKDPECEDLVKKVEGESLRKVCHIWRLYEENHNLVETFNGLFGAFMLCTFASFIITICTLLVPVLKIKVGETIPWGYLGNCIFFATRLPMMVLGPAKVHENSTGVSETISKWQVQLALVGRSSPELEALLVRLSALSDHGVTAWSFFTIKRESLLTFFSIIASYSIIMLQS